MRDMMVWLTRVDKHGCYVIKNIDNLENVLSFQNFAEFKKNQWFIISILKL